jgi:protocatechuate 3,4-dioxygenase beta subunit
MRGEGPACEAGNKEAAMTDESHPTRRRLLLAGAFAAGGLVFHEANAETLPATPQCNDGDEPTVRQTEGPYFKPSSPQRANLVEVGSQGRLVELEGRVLSRSCRPVPQALLDLWHADERGQYDNAGFRYRGHLFTDGEGRYRFRTILPALYPGRTRHYHLKVQAPRQSVLTTQLYFPDEPANRRDGLFRRELVMRTADAGDGLSARFDFVLDLR